MRTIHESLRLSVPGPLQQPLRDQDTITSANAPFAPLRIASDAMALERRNGNTAVAVKRLEFGRIAQIGYVDTWRWRMQGGASAAKDHRDWWSHLLSQVAFAKRAPATRTGNDAAPYADLVRIAGTPVPSRESSRPLPNPSTEIISVLTIFSLLVAEWISRRLRGAR